MSIKHASSVVLKEDGKAAGKGEINAAFSALDNICDFVLPMAWVRVSLWFYERAAHARSDPLTLLGMSIPPLSSGTLTHALWHWCLYARKAKKNCLQVGRSSSAECSCWRRARFSRSWTSRCFMWMSTSILSRCCARRTRSASATRCG